jgi:hypothetical protein
MTSTIQISVVYQRVINNFRIKIETAKSFFITDGQL